MANVDIPAHVDGATVEVFEPRQHPAQEEVVLDRFEMLPGEPRKDYPMRSATAGFRYLPLGDETRRRIAEKAGENEPVSVGAEGQKNPYGIVPSEEMQAGSERQQEIEAQEKKGEGQRPAKASKEEQRGASGQKAQAEGVKERGETARGSNKPHAGSPNEVGQTPLSPASSPRNPAAGPEEDAMKAPPETPAKKPK